MNQYRSPGPRLTVDIVDEDCFRPSTNWIVLENSTADESIQACARIVFEVEPIRRGLVDIFCSVLYPDEGHTEKLRLLLLSKIESIARSFSAKSLVFEIPQFNEVYQILLMKCGYADVRGRQMSSTETEKLKITKPCLILDYEVNKNTLFPYSY